MRLVMAIITFNFNHESIAHPTLFEISPHAITQLIRTVQTQRSCARLAQIPPREVALNVAISANGYPVIVAVKLAHEHSAAYTRNTSQERDGMKIESGKRMSRARYDEIVARRRRPIGEPYVGR